jgi:hypothetical protein
MSEWDDFRDMGGTAPTAGPFTAPGSGDAYKAPSAEHLRHGGSEVASPACFPSVPNGGGSGISCSRRIVVVGSREYPNLDEVRQFVFEQERDAVIISGGAFGVDTEAINAARHYRMPYEVYPARWSQHGRSAGAIRNREMVDGADEVVAFWDGKSRGTKITIDYAQAQGKPVRVIQRDNRSPDEA